jgi:RimJ/RimL family protein N-acetyltransferase/uncharacterized damage-inducible protein DinB
MSLTTARLRLIPGTPDLVRADLAGPAALAAALAHPVPPTWPPQHYDGDALRHMLARLEADPEQAGWFGYYLVLPGTGVAGVAGYKGAPARDGTVEIGYSVLSEFQCRGLASEACAALVERAFAVPEVNRIIAETLPPLLPSIRVLEKNGFRLIGGGAEPGVIRFELTRADYERGRRAIPGHLRHFITLLGHMAWADARCRRALEGAPPEPRAFRLLAHILDAEHVWIARLRGQPPEVSTWAELDLTACGDLARRNETELREFIFSLAPSDLRRLVRYRNSAGLDFSSTVEDILLHLFLHGTYHRGQVALLLRAAGGEPAATDYIAFARGAPAATGAGP